MKTTYNVFASIKGICGTFATDKKGIYLTCIYCSQIVSPKTGEPAAVPCVLHMDSPTREVLLPPWLTEDNIGLITEVLTQVMKESSYPALGYKYGAFSPIISEVDYQKEYPLGEFIPRVMTPGKEDCSEKFYRSLLKDYYDFSESFVSGAVPRNASKSLTYAPFKQLVESYKSAPERNFSLRPVEERVMRGVANGVDKFVLLQGYPGTGKTTFAKVMAMKLGLPFRESVGMFDNNDQLVGCYAVTAEKGEEKVEFIPGGLLECYEHGGIYILNEANYTRQDVMSIIQGMTDGSTSFHEKTSKRLIPRHDNFVLIMTINPKAKGSLPLNEALFNRFSAVIDYAKANSDDIFEKLKKLYPDGDSDFIGRLSKIPAIVESWAGSLNSNGFCSIRQLTSFYDSIMVASVSKEDFLEEFRIRIMNPVCSCNVFNMEKVNSICQSSDFAETIQNLYESYGGSSMVAPDAEWSLGSASVAHSADTEVDADEVADALKGFKTKL